MDDPVPAILERSATGETAEIFVDIRAVLGVEVVNLIWRHLATIDGALPWAWSTLRPHYVDGTVAREAASLYAELDMPSMPKIPSEIFGMLGFSAEDRGTIRDILSAYNHTNAMAQIALSALMSRLREGVVSENGDVSSASVIAVKPWSNIRLPRLPALGELPPDTAALVTALNRFGTNRQLPILASMYRHLAHWPAYLALSWAFLAPLNADGHLNRWINDGKAKAQRRASRFAANLPAAPADRDLAAAMRSAIEPFTGDVIAKMVVICALLHSITQDI